MELTKENLKEALVSPGHISEEEFNNIVQKAGKEREPIEQFIVKNGVMSEKHLSKTIACVFGYISADLSSVSIPQNVLEIIPEAVALAQNIIAFGETDNTLKVATSNPDNYEFIKLLEKKTNRDVKVYYTTHMGVKEVLRRYKGNLIKDINQCIDALSARRGGEEDIVKLVDLFLEYAYNNGASDIHIEPLSDDTTIRFRIDGILHKITTYPKELHEKVVFRIKILSRLRTDEQAAAQDGRFEHSIGDNSFDIRVSIIPITNGENVVMRILSKQIDKLALDTLGLQVEDMDKISWAIDKPHGMILVVGPTGSGKTTTLYTILQRLNNPEVNIMTIEDPVEYDMEGIQQIQTNSVKDLMFSTGLRSIVRQDPDVIMVGEIRDIETAEIAVNAAMTGHLLLSTMHSNDAATTFPRLVDMKVEPFLSASAVVLVVAQRLVRKVCDACRMSYMLGEKDMSLLESNRALLLEARKVSGKDDLSQVRVYKGVGCKLCGGSGYVGRTGLFEVMEMTDKLRACITSSASSDIIDSKAKEDGMTSILNDGIRKVFQGVTTLEEIVRVTRG